MGLGWDWGLGLGLGFGLGLGLGLGLGFVSGVGKGRSRASSTVAAARSLTSICIQPSSVRRVPPSGESSSARLAPLKRSGASGGSWRVDGGRCAWVVWLGVVLVQMSDGGDRTRGGVRGKCEGRCLRRCGRRRRELL